MVTPSPSAASGSSFRLPMLLLPKQKRQDMLTLYAFCRALDDAVDDAPDAATAHQNLNAWEAEISRIFSDDAPLHPIAIAMQALHRRVQFAPQDARDMLTAMRMDADGEMLYPSLPALERYCHGAACCVGLMSMRVFGCEGEHSRLFAIHLGHALQLTNIWRDIRVDAEKGRVYIAREWAGAEQPAPADIITLPAQLDKACQALSTTAAEHYKKAQEHARHLPIRSIAPALAMRDVYHHYWKKLALLPTPPSTGKLSLTHVEKAKIALRSVGYLLNISARSGG